MKSQLFSLYGLVALASLGVGTVARKAEPTVVLSARSFKHEACWTDQDALSGPGFSSPSMTVRWCARFCRGYEYFGLANGDGCHCGNSLGAGTETADRKSCNSPCTGDKSQVCGGSTKLSLYKAKEGGACHVRPSSTGLQTSEFQIVTESATSASASESSTESATEPGTTSASLETSSASESAVKSVTESETWSATLTQSEPETTFDVTSASESAATTDAAPTSESTAESSSESVAESATESEPEPTVTSELESTTTEDSVSTTASDTEPATTEEPEPTTASSDAEATTAMEPETTTVTPDVETTTPTEEPETTAATSDADTTTTEEPETTAVTSDVETTTAEEPETTTASEADTTTAEEPSTTATPEPETTTTEDASTSTTESPTSTPTPCIDCQNLPVANPGWANGVLASGNYYSPTKTGNWLLASSTSGEGVLELRYESAGGYYYVYNQCPTGRSAYCNVFIAQVVSVQAGVTYDFTIQYSMANVRNQADYLQLYLSTLPNRSQIFNQGAFAGNTNGWTNFSTGPFTATETTDLLLTVTWRNDPNNAVVLVRDVVMEPVECRNPASVLTCNASDVEVQAV